MSTYTPIASVTLSSAQSSVTFSGIPQTYTDLVVVAAIKGTTNDQAINVRFNSDSGSNYSHTTLIGTGSSAVSQRLSNQTSFRIGNGNSSSNFDPYIVSINNYSNATTYKTTLARENASSVVVSANVGLWRSTSAITAIEIFRGGGNLDAGSTFNIYGVNAQLSAQAKAYGGDTIVTDGTYWYHTFLSSGTFTPTEALTADYLVVAGGGGGGGNYGGGGGAGGLRSTVTATGGGGSLESALSLFANTNYTVTVGAGGTVGIIGGSGTNGSNSVFDSITSIGGGRGGQNDVTGGTSGASGGSGGGGTYSTTATGGAGTTGQGYAGGTSGFGSNKYPTAGGGGAGAVGGSPASSTSNAGNGGNGVAVSISGSSVTYAGGGGGGASQDGGGNSPGTGGTGGGGNGSNTSGDNATNGTANTGGGGGGAYGQRTTNATKGNGGSGIVIVRYAV